MNATTVDVIDLITQGVEREIIVFDETVQENRLNPALLVMMTQAVKSRKKADRVVQFFARALHIPRGWEGRFGYLPEGAVEHFLGLGGQFPPGKRFLVVGQCAQGRPILGAY